LKGYLFVGQDGIVVGRVVEIRPHPNRDLIWLSTIDIGTECRLQIVWGGIPIVTAGSLVAVAQPGTWLPSTSNRPHPYKIRRRHYAGEISEGMLCSLAELGWDSSVIDFAALLDTSTNLCVGQPLEDRYNDWQTIVFEIDDFKAIELVGLPIVW
jgi:tRNA-binding EMAP/Myf-like protein